MDILLERAHAAADCWIQEHKCHHGFMWASIECYFFHVIKCLLDILSEIGETDQLLYPFTEST